MTVLLRTNSSVIFRGTLSFVVGENVECVTCYVECVTASSCTAIYAGISRECYAMCFEIAIKKYGTCTSKTFLARLELVTHERMAHVLDLILAAVFDIFCYMLHDSLR